MEQLDGKRGAMPLYLQIKNIIKKKIIDKTYDYQATIPSELELQNSYKVSRITARQAILELEREGYVSRARGIGTIVIYQKKIEEFLTRIVSFTDEMKERNMVPGTKKASIEIIGADEIMAEVFHCNIGDNLYCIKRTRTADGDPIVLFVSYFSISRNLPMDHERYMGSLYELLAQLGIHSPVEVKEKFEVALADKTIATELDMKKGDPILKRSRISYDDEREILEYTISYYRGDRYSYSIEIKNIR